MTTAFIRQKDINDACTYNQHIKADHYNTVYYPNKNTCSEK